MKPRQTVKNYHNSNVPQYPHHQQQNSSTPSTRPRDVDSTKPVHLDDMPDLQATQANQDEIVKCLQAIYGKNSAELLQKLPALNDWPMQSVSPPDYPRNIGAPSNSGIRSSGSGGTCLGPGFSNNNMNKDPHHHDVQFTNSQPPHHQASTINQFRVSNTSNMHSPQQHKSVLSLHQHHHQNDLSNRRLNHHHHLSSANASFVNLSSATNSPNAAAAAAATATSTSIPSDINNLGGANIGPKNLGSSGVSTHNPNIMDSLSSLDNLFFDGNSMQVSNKDLPSSQQSLTRHQQLQKLLRASNNQLKSSSSQQSTTLSPSQRIFASSNSMSHSQHPISSSPAATISPPQAAYPSVPKSLLNLAAFSSSSSASTNTSSLPTSAKFSSMVNQLNLRSARNANQSNLNNSTTNVVNNRSLVKNVSGNTGTNNNSGINETFNQRGSNSFEQSMLQHMNRSATSTPASNSSTTNARPNQNQPFQWSILSDDQPTLSVTSRTANNLKGMCNAISGSSDLLSTASTTTTTKATLPSPQNHTYNHKAIANSTSKETYLASLQEARVARAGIGETSKPVQLSNTLSSISLVNNNSKTAPTQIVQQQQSQQNTVIISSDQSKEESNDVVDRDEIESALSRVEARNDLSLLYPPMLLASNSQKQINALSAGLQGTEDSELFTQEVKKIISEECNIIYECKECNNLFRSLANLVKHKRSFCTDHNSERNITEMNKRSYMNTNIPMPQNDPANINITGRATYSGEEAKQMETNQESTIVCSMNNGSKELGSLSSSSYPSDNLRCGPDRRANEVRVFNGRIVRNQDKKDRDIIANSRQNQDAAFNPSSSSSSLSRILQSQPKQRLPVSRNSALIGALGSLNSASASNPNITTINSVSPVMSDRNVDCSTMDVNEQLVRNSSLAKTLLNEKVKGLHPRQSLIELSKVFSSKTVEQNEQRVPRRVAPKRKALEDCIQKVKRDKLLMDDEEIDGRVMPAASNSNAVTNLKVPGQQNLSEKIESKGSSSTKQDSSTLHDASSQMDSLTESDMDSNMLMIDLDAPKKRDLIKKGKRRLSTAASSSASSSSSTSMKLNTSSALLRALTRPVDPKRPYNSTSIDNFTEKKTSEQNVDPKEGAVNMDDKSIEEDENNAELEVLSPLFEKYNCDICNIDYDDLTGLMQHTVRHHRTEKMIYPCIFCSFSFIALENVCRHIIDIHKKPKAQVHRLREVVRSRSFISSDFLACSDHPSVPEDTINEDTPIDEKILVDDIDNNDKSQEEIQSRMHNNSPKFEGMRTRGKKRVDYNQMINNDNYTAGIYSSRNKKNRSRSADNPASNLDKNIDDDPDKAVSVDGDVDYNTPVVQADELSLEPSEGSDRIDVCSIVKSNEAAEKHSLGQLSPQIHNDKDLDSSDRSRFTKPINPIPSAKSNVKQDCDENLKDLVVDSCSNESPGQLRDSSPNQKATSNPDTNSPPSSSKSPTYDPTAETYSPEYLSDPSYSQPGYDPEDEYKEDSEESIAPDEGAEQSDVDADDSSSSSGSSSSSSSEASSSGTSCSARSSPSSSSSSSSSSPEYVGARDKKETYDSETKHSSDLSVVSSGDDTQHSRDHKLIKHERTQQSKSNQETSSQSNNNSGSDVDKRIDATSNEFGILCPKTSDDTDKGQASEQRRDSITNRPSSVNKSTADSTPSSGSASGSGGIMKLKIQLKTRPDEKSKVYEIV